MEFLTGRDYPWMCAGCRSAVDQCAEEIAERVALGANDMVSGRVMIDLTDDNEAPSTLAYDRGMFCGWGECESVGAENQMIGTYPVCDTHKGTLEDRLGDRVRFWEADNTPILGSYTLCEAHLTGCKAPATHRYALIQGRRIPTI